MGAALRKSSASTRVVIDLTEAQMTEEMQAMVKKQIAELLEVEKRLAASTRPSPRQRSQTSDGVSCLS